MKSCIQVAIVLLLASACAFAQDFRATLTGIVTDPTGAAVPGATVKATNASTNTVQEVKTTSIGNYTIPFLEPGRYDVEVTATGFQKTIQKGIILRVADKVNLPLALAVGQSVESITVTATQAAIETASADRGLVFDPLKTQQLPLNGRQTYALLGLTPGVIFTNEAFGPGGHSGQRGWDVTNSYKINGARPGQNLFLLNGAPISDQNGTWQLAPNVEAVQEFKVMTNTYDASYGRFGGGVVNTTIKGGGSSWHGNVFEFFRNTVLDANRTENKQKNTARPAHNQHQFGGVIGGPIRKDKDFVFLSFEGFREIQPASVISSVPAAGLRDGQHFSDYGITIYDPLTTRVCTGAICRNSPFIREAFPGNVIPQSRISPVAQKVLSYYPTANGPNPKAMTGNYYTNTNGRYRYEQPMGRWDHNFNDNNKFYALVTFQNGTEYRNSTGFAPPAGSGDINSERTDQNYVASWTRILSPTSVLDLRASYGRFTSSFPRYTDYDFTTDKLGMTQMVNAPTVTKASVPRFDVDTLTNLFAGGSSGEWNTYNQWNLTGSVMRTMGKHTLRFGGEMNYVARAVGDKGYANGRLYFDQSWTRQLSSVGGGSLDGSSIASLLLGNPRASDSQIDWNNNPYRTRPYYAMYVQDDWKVARNVVVNMGIRYDVQVPWKERFGRSNRGFDLSVKNPYSDQVLANWRRIKAEEDAKNPKYPYPDVPTQLNGGFLFPGVNGQPERLYDTDYTNIGPRAGIAWQAAPKTVLRAGAGVYYMSPTQDNTQNGFSQTTPYIATIDGMTPSAGANLSGPYSLVNPFPAGLQTPTGSSAGLATLIGRGVSWDPAGFKIPRTYQYSFGIQQELPGSIVLEVSYAGNYQIYINASTNYNEISMANLLKSQADAQYRSLQVPNPFFGILPANGGQGQNPTIDRGGLMRPNPIFQGMTDNLSQWGRYRSDALQTKVEKRMLSSQNAGNFTWVLSHTWAKAFEQNHRLNNWNLDEPLIYEIDNNNKPQVFAFSGLWDLPVGKGKKFLNTTNSVASHIVSDWQLIWIYTFSSGYPTGWPDLVNKCGDWHAKNQDRNHWFNNDKSCYTTRPGNTFRIVPDRFSDIRNPSQKQLNLAVEKGVQINERFRFTIKGEAFNLTNTPNYAGPNTDFNNERFGRLPDNQQNWPRLIQFSAKFFF